MENIPMNSTLITSHHYNDLCQDSTLLYILRTHIFSHLEVYQSSFDGEIKARFDDAGFLTLIAALFPARYEARVRELIADYLKRAKDEAEDEADEDDQDDE